MSLFSRLFPTMAEVSTTSKDLKKAEKTIEVRDQRIESLEKSIKTLKADHEDHKFYEGLDKKRVVRAHEHIVEDERDSSARAVRNAEADAEYSEDEADSRAEFAIEKAGIDARKTVASDVKKLETDLSKAQTDSARDGALASERSTTIKNLVEENSRLSKLLTEILTKVPDVTLDKFNINVEVPPAEVTVVTAGKQGGGKKDN